PSTSRFSFIKAPRTPWLYTLSLHDALPILSEKTEAIAEIAAPMALDIKAFGPVAAEAEAVAQFARSVMMAFGGLDVVVNLVPLTDRKSTRLNSSHQIISYAVFCLKKKNNQQ